MAKKILVIEDEPDILQLVSTYLEREGYRVCAALTGTEGIKLAKAEHPDLVVSISRDRFGIGYSSIGFQTSAVRAVALAQKDGMPFVEPTQESVTRGNYPLSRRLYLYINRAPDENVSAVITEFLKFVNSRRGQAMVATTGSYPISVGMVARNLQNLMTPPAGAPVTPVKDGRTSN